MTPTERNRARRLRAARLRAARRRPQAADLRPALEAGGALTYDGAGWRLVPHVVVDLDLAVDLADAAERVA